MNKEILERIKQFIYKEGFGYNLPFPFLFKKKIITSEMEIEKDLKITGDDADEFLMAFSKEFNVDVSHFPIGEYFGDEVSPVVPLLVKKRKPIKALTIADLEKAVVAGRLDEEVINS